jgi:hypothetical protein
MWRQLGVVVLLVSCIVGGLVAAPAGADTVTVPGEQSGDVVVTTSDGLPDGTPVTPGIVWNLRSIAVACQCDPATGYPSTGLSVGAISYSADGTTANVTVTNTGALGDLQIYGWIPSTPGTYVTVSGHVVINGTPGYLFNAWPTSITTTFPTTNGNNPGGYAGFQTCASGQTCVVTIRILPWMVGRAFSEPLEYSPASGYNPSTGTNSDYEFGLIPLNVPAVATTPPTAVFSATSDPSTAGTVDFDATASTPSTGATIQTYAWSFGDGTPTATTTTPTTTHAYATGGSHTVSLMVTDSAGQRASVTNTLHFPTAAFSYTPAPSDPKTINFDGSASSASGGATVSTYVWDFGDGSAPVSTHAPTVSHTYARGGVQTVTLTVTDSNNQTSPPLANPVVVAAFEVNSNGDSGSVDPTKANCDTGQTVVVAGQTVPECTLRAAIQAADVAGSGNITFDLNASVGNGGTIQPLTALPALTAPGVTIDGTTGPNGIVQLNGFSLDQNVPDLHISGKNDVLQGFTAENSYTVVLIDSVGGGDVVRDCMFGLTGTFTASDNVGVDIENSPDNVVGGVGTGDRDVLSELSIGVLVHGAAATGNRILGDYLGTDASGTVDLGDYEGVDVADASGTVIGGPTSTPGRGPGNVIDGRSTVGGATYSGSFGITVAGFGLNATGTVIQGNTLGLMADGMTPASDTFAGGVNVTGRASGTLVGGSAAGDANVISGATGPEVLADGTFVVGTQVLGNLIGTDTTGENAVPHSGFGVLVTGARTTTIGTAGSGHNLITGQTTGVQVVTNPLAQNSPLYSQPFPGTATAVPGVLSTLISGNVIGSLADGISVPTSSVETDGVVLSGSGDTLGPNNEISYNATGVVVTTVGETVVGNSVGTDATGLASLPNGTGVEIGAQGLSGFTLGVAGAKPNTISGNLDNVVLVSPTTMQNNYVGTTTLGNASVSAYSGSVPDAIQGGLLLANAPGVFTTAAGTVIGGTRPGMGNVISGNGNGGLTMTGTAVVEGNKIGVGADGVTPVPNQGMGVVVDAPSQIGGSATTGGPPIGPWAVAGPAGGNVIADNTGSGVDVATTAAPSTIESDSIYANGGSGILHASGPVAGPGLFTPPTQDGEGKTVVGYSTATATAGTIVQVYAGDSCTQGGAQGRTLLQTDTINAPGVVLAVLPLQPVGTPLTATVTVPGVGTSDFAACSTVSPKSATITPMTVRPGQTSTATGTGFTPGEQVDATLHSDPIDLGDSTANGAGDVTVTFTVPAALPQGQHELVLTGLTSGHAGVAGFTVAGPTRSGHGYREVTSGGGVVTFGDAASYGSAGSTLLNGLIVGTASTPDGKGYWLVASDGGVFAYGDAAFYGSMGGRPLSRPIVGMAATPDGTGYWLVASDGGVFAYGDAAFYGSMGGRPLSRPIVGMAATPDGKGYWLVASDGGVFAYGDAAFYGSEGGAHLGAPVVGMSADTDGKGYWLVASDGGVFSFGDAMFHGSEGGAHLSAPVVGEAATPDGKGYWLVAADGGVFSFGDAAFYGSEGGAQLRGPVVGLASS